MLDHRRWLRDQVLPVAYTRSRNKLIGRQPGDGFTPKRRGARAAVLAAARRRLTFAAYGCGLPLMFSGNRAD